MVISSNLQAAAIFNDFLIEQGNKQAIWRKMEGLVIGKYGYEQNLQAAAILNDSLVEQGNKEAIERKIEGLLHGWHGYEKN